MQIQFQVPEASFIQLFLTPFSDSDLTLRSPRDHSAIASVQDHLLGTPRLPVF